MQIAEMLLLPAGDELNALVAVQVMGSRMDGDTLTDGRRCWPVPDYSTDIAAAWTILDRLSAFFSEYHLSRGPRGYFCLFADKFSHRTVEGPLSESAPLAILRAALLAEAK